MSNVSYFKNANNFEVKSIAFKTYVSGMDATGAIHDSEERYPAPMCHLGTREVVIVRIKDWFGIQARPNKPIMWVHAPAGYGKTAIAGTISKMLEEVEGLDFSPLGATFYFWRTSPERNSPARFIITIAYQLAMSIPELAPHVENAIKRNRLIFRKSLEVQLAKLIVEPFQALGDLENVPNRLVLIDGLDECIRSSEEISMDLEKQHTEEQEKAQIRILGLIDTLQSYHLPLSFLVLSRPEAWIRQHMHSAHLERVVEELNLYAFGRHLQDAKTYIRAELARIAARIDVDGGLAGQDKWPGEDLVRAFVRKTNGHMLYASIVIRQIDNPYEDPRKLLQSLLDTEGPKPDLEYSSPLSSLHQLYRQILQSCPIANRPRMIEVLEELEVACGLLNRTVSFQRALTILDGLVGRIPGQGFRALRPLHAVLRVSQEEDPRFRGMLSFSPYAHSTFPSFLRDPCPSLGLPIDPEKGNQRILRGSLACMSKIMPHTDVNADHFQIACRAWPWLFRSGWALKIPDAQYFEFVKKLLTIDLSTCCIQSLRLDDDIRLLMHWKHDASYELWYRNDSSNPVVPRSAGYIFESDALVQQAVAHTVSSFEAALVHFLNQTCDAWPYFLRHYVFDFVRHLNERPTAVRGLDDHGMNQVLQALERLQRQRPEDARSLAGADREGFKSLLPFEWVV